MSCLNNAKRKYDTIIIPIKGTCDVNPSRVSARRIARKGIVVAIDTDWQTA